jgi:hypothetical protein
MFLMLAAMAAAHTLPLAGRESAVRSALQSLNLYVETIAQNDACLHRTDMRLVDALNNRIRRAQDLAVTTFPAIDPEAGKGETDYVCARRSDEEPHVSRRAIRHELLRLVRQVEDLLQAAEWTSR